MFASVNSGRPPCTGGCEEVTVAFFEPSATVNERVSTLGDDSVMFASTEFGRTVIIGVPWETFECTVVEPPKTNCVAVISAETSTASVIMPEPDLTAVRAATSLPNACDATRTAAGAWAAIICAKTSATAATPFAANASDSTTIIFAIGPRLIAAA